MYDLIVIGGGPAGMMAAATAASCGIRVMLLEKMPQPGRKLLLTGNGRCNLTNDLEPARFIRDCGPRARFLHNALNRFSNHDTVRFFAEQGIIARIENGHSYFPVSGGAAGVLKALERLLRETGAEIRTSVSVGDVRHSNSRFELQTNAGILESAKLVIATGGKSYPQTGSAGDGYALAERLGHAVTACLPGNAPLVLEGGWVAALQGVSLGACVLSCETAGRVRSFPGGLIFTHDGISGPAALDASRILAPALEHGPAAASIDLLPRTDGQRLARELVSLAARFGKKKLKGLAGQFMPDRLAQAVIERAGLRAEIAANQLTTEQRASVVRTVKRFDAVITGTRGFGEAMVTVGGVDTRDIEPATMGSKKIPGLFFCGEVLDLDGPCGGYNLQIAWTTGQIAGRSAASGAS